MGRSGDNTPSFIEADGSFITKPLDIANYFNDFFVGKIENLKKLNHIIGCQFFNSIEFF